MSRSTHVTRVGFLCVGAAFISTACGLLIDLPEPGDQTEDDIGWGGLPGEGGSGGRRDTSLGGSGSSEGGVGGDVTTSGGGTLITNGSGGMGGELPEGCIKHCDCDNDGALAKGECGGDDCDDKDERAFPGQTEFFDERSDNALVGFDFNCNGELDRPDGQTVAVKCDQLALLACEDGQGFLGDLPACGYPGEWGSCYVLDLVSCGEDVADQEKVASCR